MAHEPPKPKPKLRRGSFLPEAAAARMPRQVTRALHPPGGQPDTFGDRLRALGVPVDDQYQRNSFLSSLLSMARRG